MCFVDFKITMQQAFSGGRRCHEVTDEVFYNACFVEHYDKNFIF